MSAYYNEIDPFAAQWLRDLIAAKHIAAGDVDERSIADVQADDVRGYRQCHFFAGIGGWSFALRLAGWPDDRPVWTGSCPCQPFSAAGRRAGVGDERHLWPHFFRLISAVRPGVVMGEQVASKDGLAWLDLVHADLEGSGYAVRAADLCAAGVGAPHIRQRLWFMAHREVDGGGEGRALALRRDEGAGAQGAGLGSADDGRRSVAHHHHRRQGEPLAGLRRPEVHDADGCGTVGLADRERAGLEVEREQQAWGQRASAERGGAAGMADAAEQGRGEQPRRDGGAHGRASEELGRLRDAGAWSACDWIPCRDGKARPVEPGTFPLAHGVSGRVGRLRAYGNAIVPQVAAEVIAAFMEETP